MHNRIGAGALRSNWDKSLIIQNICLTSKVQLEDALFSDGCKIGFLCDFSDNAFYLPLLMYEKGLLGSFLFLGPC